MTDEQQTCELTELKSLVAQTIDGADGWDALVALEQQNEIFRSLFPSDPRAAVSADHFIICDELIDLALQLAQEFGKRAQGDYEEHAYRLRSKAVCTAHSFARHFVGPAMLDWADCSLRLGKREIADTIYTAIIKDFTELIRREPVPTKECLIALQSLERALQNHSKPYDMLLKKTRDSIRSIKPERPPG